MWCSQAPRVAAVPCSAVQCRTRQGSEALGQTTPRGGGSSILGGFGDSGLGCYSWGWTRCGPPVPVGSGLGLNTAPPSLPPARPPPRPRRAQLGRDRRPLPARGLPPRPPTSGRPGRAGLRCERGELEPKPPAPSRAAPALLPGQRRLGRAGPGRDVTRGALRT